MEYSNPSSDLRPHGVKTKKIWNLYFRVFGYWLQISANRLSSKQDVLSLAGGGGADGLTSSKVSLIGSYRAAGLGAGADAGVCARTESWAETMSAAYATVDMACCKA